jgi:phytoene dehydrogenase-like protein
MSEKLDVIVVGSGPNGLAAAITLARAGIPVRILEATDTVGGGLRSAALTRDGFVHDVCSAVHPLAVSSPFFSQLALEKFGLEWIHPDIPLAHPLDKGNVACLYRSLETTAQELGRDAASYSKLMLPFVRRWKALASEFLQPILHVPRHPITLARFGLKALRSAEQLASSRFKDPSTRALFAGIAGHSFLPLEKMASAAFGLVLAAAGHAVGWPIPRGGSQRIAEALAGCFRGLGGEIEFHRPIQHWEALPKHRAVFFDVTAWQLEKIAESRLPKGYRRRLRNFRHAPGVCKIDYALSAPVPWTAEPCRHAGTIHVGGTFEEIAHGEREVAHGRHPERPFVLLAQQSVFDSSRAPGGHHTLWAYCHVPYGSTFDMSARIEAQIERFAPGFRDCILERHVLKSADMEARNPSLIGGDISGGANNFCQLLARPTFGFTPFRTPHSDIWLCSSSTPPGGGVHGMCGFNAARAWLRTHARS